MMRTKYPSEAGRAYLANTTIVDTILNPSQTVVRFNPLFAKVDAGGGPVYIVVVDRYENAVLGEDVKLGEHMNIRVAGLIKNLSRTFLVHLATRFSL